MFNGEVFKKIFFKVVFSILFCKLCKELITLSYAPDHPII